MAIEKEFLAMRSIDRAFASLKTDEDRERVVKWTVDKYSPAPKSASSMTGSIPMAPQSYQQPMHQTHQQHHGIN